MEVGGMSREGRNIYTEFISVLQGGNLPCANRSRGWWSEADRALAVLGTPEPHAGALERTPHQAD